MQDKIVVDVTNNTTGRVQLTDGELRNRAMFVVSHPYETPINLNDQIALVYDLKTPELADGSVEILPQDEIIDLLVDKELVQLQISNGTGTLPVIADVEVGTFIIKSAGDDSRIPDVVLEVA